MKLLERVKKARNEKGFTLVELIVVLVILAILAAILVPALLGYIDRARGSQDLLNAKSYLTASQAAMSELYGQNKKASEITGKADAIEAMADAKAKKLVIATSKAASDDMDHAEYIVTYVEYTSETTGKTVWFDGTAWFTEKDGTFTEPAANLKYDILPKKK